MKTQILSLLLLAALGTARAADYAIEWWTVDGGGVTASASADGRLTLGGTIGQPDAGTLNGDPFSLFGGFWQPDAPAPCDCRLTITRRGANLVLTWPACCGGWVLEYATDLINKPPGWKPGDPETEWHAVTPSPTGNTDTFPASERRRFFQLRRP